MLRFGDTACRECRLGQVRVDVGERRLHPPMDIRGLHLQDSSHLRQADQRRRALHVLEVSRIVHHIEQYIAQHNGARFVRTEDHGRLALQVGMAGEQQLARHAQEHEMGVAVHHLQIEGQRAIDQADLTRAQVAPAPVLGGDRAALQLQHDGERLLQGQPAMPRLVAATGRIFDVKRRREDRPDLSGSEAAPLHPPDRRPGTQLTDAQPGKEHIRGADPALPALRPVHLLEIERRPGHGRQRFHLSQHSSPPQACKRMTAW